MCDFISQALEDLSSPTTSSFTSYMSKCRATVCSLEEVRGMVLCIGVQGGGQERKGFYKLEGRWVEVREKGERVECLFPAILSVQEEKREELDSCCTCLSA